MATFEGWGTVRTELIRFCHETIRGRSPIKVLCGPFFALVPSVQPYQSEPNAGQLRHGRAKIQPLFTYGT